ncbi:MAG TPA: BMP family ABC transporter substrate-binding protein, partial [Myxococcaceae bacterium]|nr:BMP family ABC transporter substrate-binding protein [Myxococcaceae bacterium]
MFGLLLVAACKKQEEAKPEATAKASEAAAKAGEAAPEPKEKSLKVGLVTDVGGRGDQSFNDSALRGLELWAAGKKMVGDTYQPATAEELKATLQQDLLERESPITPVNVTPIVLQSKVPQDYQPNLQMLADEGAALAIGVGFMLENAVEEVAKQNPDIKFLLIDSPVLSGDNKPYSLPNVR